VFDAGQGKGRAGVGSFVEGVLGRVVADLVKGDYRAGDLECVQDSAVIVVFGLGVVLIVTAVRSFCVV
jgi:hypothetical protein